MATAAAQVSDFVAARLANVAATAGRIYTDRAEPIPESQLPCWRLVLDDEQVEALTFGDVEQHQLTLLVHGLARAVAGLDDVLDALDEAARVALFATPPAALIDLQLSRISRRLADEGEAAVGVLTLELRAQFQTRQSVPGTLL